MSRRLLRLTSLAGVAALAALAALPLQAQQHRAPPKAPPTSIKSNSPEVVPDAPIPTGRKGFSLFANADFAVAGLKMTGQAGWGVTNNGPITNWTVTHNTVPGSILDNGVFNQEYIGGINFAASAPPSEARKIRNGPHPNISTMRPPFGYTSLLYQGLLAGFPQRWGPADHSIGRLFNGNAVSTADNSCTDYTGDLSAAILTGFTSLAVSDCPPTWAATGYDGPRIINDSAFLRLRATQADSFRFDFWKVPQDERGDFLGTVSTYGETWDAPQEILQAYGSVTKLGAGGPTLPGYPLGLEIRFEYFQFARPQINNALFMNMIVVNNSERLYGEGIDYDSLYMGLTHGFISNGDQFPGVYHIVGQNAVVSTGAAVNSGSACNGAIVVPGTPTCAGTGIDQVVGIIMLKSPIGDERNKLLSTAGSAFFSPASPFADDTITFNNARQCGFGANCWNNTYAFNDRRGFGMMSSTEENVLDGRDPASLTAGQTWGHFHNPAFRGTPGVDFARFPRYVPGNWDWNNDGVQDTLSYDDCAAAGCVAPFADTMPGKQVNSGGNVGGGMFAGPFKLRAGDTTAFVFAFVGAPDSAGFMALLPSVRQAYREFYAGPQPPPAATVVSVAVNPPPRGIVADTVFQRGVRATVELRYTPTPSASNDPFLEKFATDLLTSTDPAFQRLNALNPGLVDSIRARALAAGTTFTSQSGEELTATGNFSELWIFRSCDNGTTFDADGDCVGDPTTAPNGSTVGLGWQPFSIVRADPATGRVPTTFTDDTVTAGRTYLYSLVARTRGFSAPVRDINAEGDTIVRVLTVADTITGPLQRSGPTTATVYVPISLPAGARAASAQVKTTSGSSTVPVTVDVSRTPVPGSYRLIFANRFAVTVETNTSTGVVTTTVRAQDVIPAADTSGTGTGTPVTSFVANDVVLTTPGRIDFSGAEFAPSVTTSGALQFETDTIEGFGYVAAQGTRPLFITTDLTPSGATPASFTDRTDFPGFTVELNQAVTDSLRRDVIILPSGDSLQATIRDLNAAVEFLEDSSDRPTTVERNGNAFTFGAGTYSFIFSDDSYGPDAPFLLDTVGVLETQVAASLNSRATAATGTTDTSIARIIVNSVPAYESAAARTADSLPLVAAKFPFVVVKQRGRDAGGGVDTLILAMVRRDSLHLANGQRAPNSVQLGTPPDTVRVNLPSDVWVPGDQFVVLEEAERDSVVNGVVVFKDTTVNGATVKRPIQVLDTVVAFGPAMLGCGGRPRCNPIALTTRGATNYLPYDPVGSSRYQVVIAYPIPFDLASEVRFDITGVSTAGRMLTQGDLRQVRVVPNPYIVQSQYDRIIVNQAQGNIRVPDARIIFSGVPEMGTLRIFSVSGQFLQELNWTAADLESVNNATGTGDLPYNLRTREGIDLSSGLYIYVLTAKGPTGGNQKVRGKFVVIR